MRERGQWIGVIQGQFGHCKARGMGHSPAHWSIGTCESECEPEKDIEIVLVLLESVVGGVHRVTVVCD